MVKPIINYTIKAYKLPWGAPLQVIPSAYNLGTVEIYTVINSIFDFVKPDLRIKHQVSKNLFLQYFVVLEQKKIYNLKKMRAVTKEKLINADSCKSNDQSQSLTGLLGGNCVCQN